MLKGPCWAAAIGLAPLSFERQLVLKPWGGNWLYSRVALGRGGEVSPVAREPKLVLVRIMGS